MRQCECLLVLYVEHAHLVALAADSTADLSPRRVFLPSRARLLHAEQPVARTQAPATHAVKRAHHDHRSPCELLAEGTSLAAPPLPLLSEPLRPT